MRSRCRDLQTASVGKPPQALTGSRDNSMAAGRRRAERTALRVRGGLPTEAARDRQSSYADRCFATTRFRCTGTRYNGAPCQATGVPVIRPAELLRVGGPVTLAFLTCPRCIWEINQAQLDKPPWSGSRQRYGGLGTVLLHLRRRRACPILNSNCSSIHLALHRPP